MWPSVQYDYFLARFKLTGRCSQQIMEIMQHERCENVHRARRGRVTNYRNASAYRISNGNGSRSSSCADADQCPNSNVNNRNNNGIGGNITATSVEHWPWRAQLDMLKRQTDGRTKSLEPAAADRGP